jgi:two-component system response regulator RstA
VLLGGESVALSTADFDLLWELATHAGQIMDRDALLKNLRGVTYDGMDRSVDVAISRLRKKLLDNATEPYRIKTVRNKGYLFAPTPGITKLLCGPARGPFHRALPGGKRITFFLRAFALPAANLSY